MRSTILAGKRARSLRRSLSAPEVVLWSALRRNATGARFRRQHPLGPYILDFYCPAARLAVEVDGAGHGAAAQAAHDRVRDAWLAARGVTVLRFAAADVLDEEGREAVLASIARAVAPSTASGGPPPPLRG